MFQWRSSNIIIKSDSTLKNCFKLIHILNQTTVPFLASILSSIVSNNILNASMVLIMTLSSSVIVMPDNIDIRDWLLVARLKKNMVKIVSDCMCTAKTGNS